MLGAGTDATLEGRGIDGGNGTLQGLLSHETNAV
jgi:hypothetical protein